MSNDFTGPENRFRASGSSVPGLAVCKQIVQNHGGTIGVRNPEEDQKSGAAFVFSMHWSNLIEPVNQIIIVATQD